MEAENARLEITNFEVIPLASPIGKTQRGDHRRVSHTQVTAPVQYRIQNRDCEGAASAIED
jgi:hypothetical protein